MAYVGNTPFGPSCPSPTRVFAQVNTGFRSVRRSVGLAHDPTSQETPASEEAPLPRTSDEACPCQSWHKTCDCSRPPLPLVRRSQLASQCFQLLVAFGSRLGVGHFKVREGVEDDLGDDESGVLFVVGGHYVPGRAIGAGRVQAGLVGLHVLVPVGPLMDVREAELPVFVGRVNSSAETVCLLGLRQVQEDLDDLGAVAVQMCFEVADGAVALFPDGLLIDQLLWETVIMQDLGVYPGDEYVFVVGAVEDADPSAFG